MQQCNISVRIDPSPFFSVWIHWAWNFLMHLLIQCFIFISVLFVSLRVFSPLDKNMDFPSVFMHKWDCSAKKCTVIMPLDRYLPTKYKQFFAAAFSHFFTVAIAAVGAWSDDAIAFALYMQDRFYTFCFSVCRWFLCVYVTKAHPFLVAHQTISPGGQSMMPSRKKMSKLVTERCSVIAEIPYIGSLVDISRFWMPSHYRVLDCDSSSNLMLLYPHHST